MIANVLIPVTVVMMMVIVGAGLQLEQFKAVLRAPLPLISGTLVQLLLLPVGAMLIVALLDPAPALAAGLLLVAACPGGALSNYYCHLGRLNVALSVSLTAISSILAFAALPVVLAATFPTIATIRELEIPVGQLTYRLFLLLLLPVATGMLLRSRFPRLVIGHERRLRVLSLVLVVLLLALIIIHQWETAQRLFLDAAMLATLFSGFAALAGWATGLFLRLDRTDRYVFALEFAIRNVGVAAVVGATSLGRPEFVTFGALFVVAQFPLVALLLYIHLQGRGPGSSATVDRS